MNTCKKAYNKLPLDSKDFTARISEEWSEGCKNFLRFFQKGSRLGEQAQGGHSWTYLSIMIHMADILLHSQILCAIWQSVQLSTTRNTFKEE